MQRLTHRFVQPILDFLVIQLSMLNRSLGDGLFMLAGSLYVDFVREHKLFVARSRQIPVRPRRRIQ